MSHDIEDGEQDLKEQRQAAVEETEDSSGNDSEGNAQKWEKFHPSNLMEKAFFRHGQLVGQHPWVFVVGCLVMALACGTGLYVLQWETNVIKLWNPTSSENWKNFQWLWKNHPPDLRRHSIIFRADNVLTVDSLKKIFKVREEIFSLVTPGNFTWNDACLKVPVIPFALARVLSPSQDLQKDKFFKDDFFDDSGDKSNKDPALDWYPDPLCTIYNNLKRACLEDSILELFGSDGDVTIDQIESLSDEDVVEAINNGSVSKMFSVSKDFKGMLGDVVFDDNGNVIKAGVITMTLYGKMNVTETHLDKGREGAVFGKQLSIEQLDDATNEVEDAMIEFLRSRDDEENFDVLANIAKSFQESVNHQILSDVPKIAASFVVMFLYVSATLGKFNCMDNRIPLAQFGLASILMALATSYGVCSLLGFEMSPLHNFIPFLLLGLGVDDMFVIVRSHDCKTSPEGVRDEVVTKRIAETMKHSGVAITVTSLTDFLAFAIGGTTTIPALRSFCMFCGIGIVSVYVYQATWFVAWLAIDERRKHDQRYALVPCIKRFDEDRGSNEGSEPCKKFLRWWSGILAKFPFQMIIIAISASFLGISIYGNIHLKQEFDPWLFLPPTEPLRVWKDVHVDSFPTKGERVLVIFEGGEDIDLKKLDWMANELSSQTDIIAEVDSWYLAFKNYYEDNYEEPFSNLTWNADLKRKMMQFLHSGRGGKYRYLINFDKDPVCGGPLPKIETHIMEFEHVVLGSSSEGVEAMNRVKEIIKGAGFKTRVFPFSQFYSVLEIDEIIRGELYRNLGLASVAIYIATLMLLSSFKGSLFCMLSVFCTLANVSGIMFFWGLTIDTVTCTVLIVCIGLSVDFSAHVVHSFMHTSLQDASKIKESGSAKAIKCARFFSDRAEKKLRMRAGIEAVAPAVLHGGLSTLLAVVFLAFSEVYVFVAFFKIFVLVVSFGLYNGLVLLPVLLSLFGPELRMPGKLYVDEEAVEEFNLKSRNMSVGAITPLPSAPNLEEISKGEDS